MSTPKKIMRTYMSPRELAFDSLCYRLLPLLPEKTTPNQVTLAAGISYILAGPAFFLAGFNRTWFLVAVAGLLIHVIGDNLDGELARRTGNVSRGGMFLDYFIDSLGTSAVCIGMACSGYFSPLVGMLFMLAWFLHLVTALSSSLLADRWIFPRFSVFEMHLGLVALALAGYFFGVPRWRVLGIDCTYFDIIWTVSGVFSLTEVFRLALGLFRDISAPAEQA